MRNLNVKIKAGKYKDELAQAIEVVNGNFLCILDNGDIVQVPTTCCLAFPEESVEAGSLDMENVIKHFEDKIGSIIDSHVLSNNRLNDLAHMHETLSKNFVNSSLKFSEGLSSLETVKKMHTERLRIVENKIETIESVASDLENGLGKDLANIENRCTANAQRTSGLENDINQESKGTQLTLKDIKLKLLECSGRLDNHMDSIDRNFNLYKELSTEKILPAPKKGYKIEKKKSKKSDSKVTD